jgi:prevent-host-death family protein
MSASTARRDFGEVVNRAYYAKEATVITKHGKELAAVVPMSALPADFDAEHPKKKPGRVSPQKQSGI